jgi:hypothetical protein
MRPLFAVVYFGMALAFSLATVWWVGPALVGLLVLLYLIMYYAPWLFFFGDGG